jgi:folate-binding protein YgfZ
VDPFAEQKSLEAGQGYVHLSDRAVLKVTGSDRLTWLDSLTSHRIPAGHSAQTLVLDPHGHVEYDLHVVDDGDATWLIVSADTAESLQKYLDSMRFLMDVAVEAVGQQVYWVPIRQTVPGHPTWLIPLEFAGRGFTDSGADRGGDALKYVPHRPGTLVGAEVIGWHPEQPEYSRWAYDALRIAAGVPHIGIDSDARSLPHELGLIGPAVHLAKGCYRGQETVARLHNMGRPPRRLVLVHFDGALPDPNDEVLRDGKAVGRVGSVAHHYELGPIGLAVVKRSVPVTEELQAGGIALAQEEIVSASL